jgi:hypothetical protein
MYEPWKDSPEDDGVPEHLRFAVDLPDLDKMEPDEQIEFLREYLRKLREHRDEVAAAGIDIDALLMAGAHQLDVADSAQRAWENAQEDLLQSLANGADAQHKLFKMCEQAIEIYEAATPSDPEIKEWRKSLEEMRSNFPKE